jgi:hypothetical protein
VWALRSAGALYPVGVVGLVAGLVYWLVAAHRGGLLDPRRFRAEARTERHPQPPPAGPARRGDTRRLPLPGEQDPARRGR